MVGGYRIFHRLRPPIVICDLTFQGSGLAGLGLIRRMRAVVSRIADRLARAGLPLYAQHVDPLDTGTLVEIQGTAEGAPFNRDLLNQLLDLAAGGCATLKQVQSEALGVSL